MKYTRVLAFFKAIRPPKFGISFQNVWLFISKLLSSKSRYFTIASIVIFVFSFALALVPTFYLRWVTGEQGKATINVSVNILLGIGTSLLATSLIATIQLLDFNELRKFKKLFALQNNKKVAIVIPTFNKKRLYDKITDRLPETILEESKKKELVDKVYGNTDLFSDEAAYIGYADFEAIKYLITLFEKFQYNIPDIITDDEALIDLNDSQKYNDKYSTYISIGTFSNRLSRHIEENNKIGTHDPNPKFQFGTNKAEPKARKIILEEVLEIGNCGYKTYSPEILGCADIALFAKFTFGETEYNKLSVFVLGGLNATGTTALGKFIFDKWESHICCTKSKHITDNIEREIIKEDNFSIVYEVIGDRMKNNIHYDTSGRINTKPAGIRI